MYIQIWLLPAILASTTFATPSPSPTPQHSSSPQPQQGGYYPSSSQRPVYTAQRIRDTNQSPEDDEPYPSTASLGTAQTINGAEEPENTGFVDPIDFKALLRDVESSSKGLSSSSNNPLYASESKNSFAGFFGSNNKDPFADFGGSGLATASSDRSTKSPESEDSTGFVDPNVQFRSLFDSSQTASNGFKPEDFLGNQGGSSGVEPSRGSQTRAFPSFTYTGRKEDEQPNRYRSNFRQPETSDDDYSDNYRGRDDREDSPPNYNNDRGNGYYRGNHGPSRGPSPSSPRYNQGGPRYSPEETSNRPQSTGRGPKASASNNNPKCKKVEKTVEYENNDDYSSFTEPEQDYDPSTYRGRYKRQSRQGRQARGGNKRPMTCYVCEDEHGRYAERCSYDSKSNPNKGEYFHSSSSAFSDNGRRPSGKERQRRNPASRRNSQSHETSGTPQILKNKVEVEESEPKIIEKRQTRNGPPPPPSSRYASNFGGRGPPPQGPGPTSNNRNGEFDFNPPNYGGNGDFNLPRGYIGNNGGRAEEFDNPQSTSGVPRGGGDNYGFGGDNNNNNNNREFNFGPEPNFNDFGPGNNDYGRESSSSPSGSSNGQGFNYDFSIPREYDPDIQYSNDNSNSNRPGLSGSASSNADSPSNFDTEYNDYVKRYFPEFGSTSSEGGHDGPSSSESPRRHSSPSFTPNSGPPVNYHHNPPSYRPRDSPRDNSFNQFNPSNNPHHESPDKEHTQPSYNFAPPPDFFNGSPESPESADNTQGLNKLMANFEHGKDRSGCQKTQKGDMTCYVCRDARGMNKEECMYASNGDPRNQKMAYHEVTEYSSDPPASILPRPATMPNNNPQNIQSTGQHTAASAISLKTVPSPTAVVVAKRESGSETSKPSSNRKSFSRVQSSVVISTNVKHEKKSPLDYDFDY